MGHAARMRIRRALVAVVVMFASSVTAVGAHAQDEASTSTTTTAALDSMMPVSTDTVDVQQDVPYYDGGPVLDVYLPKNGQTKRPALVLVHGGGWNSGDEAEFAPYAMQAANEQHWVVFDVDFLLSPSDGSSWPDALHDLQAAIRFIATNAQNFGVDPQKIVALGESAGASLLALVSAEGTANPVIGEPTGDDPTLAVPLRAVGLWSPPVDLADLYANAGQPPASCGPDRACDFVGTPGAIAGYMHCDPTSCPQAYAEASPITWVTANTAPSFVANSTTELVPLGQVVQYVMTLQNAHVDVQFAQLPGSLHGMEYAAQVWSQTIVFLGQQLTAPTPTTTAPAPDAEPATAVTPVPTPRRDEGPGASLWPWLVGAGVVVVGTLAALTAYRRRARPKDPGVSD
jgi:acetyl esterase